MVDVGSDGEVEIVAPDVKDIKNVPKGAENDWPVIVMRLCSLLFAYSSQWGETRQAEVFGMTSRLSRVVMAVFYEVSSHLSPTEPTLILPDSQREWRCPVRSLS